MNYYSLILISLEGIPPTIVFDATSFVTALPAAKTAPLPMVTPVVIIQFAPIQTSSSMIIFL